MSWDELTAAIDAKNWDAAIVIALEEWRREKRERLADLVDWLGAQVTPLFAPRGNYQTSWLVAAKAMENVGLILPGLSRALPKEKQPGWVARIDALAARGDDPRIARALLGVIAKGAWATTSNDELTAMTEPALKLVLRTGDRRLAVVMRELLTYPVARSRTLRAHLDRVLPEAITALEALPTFPTDDAQVEQITGKAGAPADDNALFDLVIAEPDNDAPRLVIADYWQERGNARGEFVSTQLAKTDYSYRSKIARKYDKAWLGPLAQVTKENRRYARGFLSRIELAKTSAADEAVWEAALHARDLLTVEDLWKGSANENLCVRFLRAARSLKVLRAPTQTLAMGIVAEGQTEPWSAKHLFAKFAVPTKLAKTLAGVCPRLDEVSLMAKEGGVPTLIEVATIFAERGPVKLNAVIEHTGVEPHQLAELLLAPIGRERWIQTGSDRWDRSTSVGIAAKAGKAGGLEVEVCCPYLTMVAPIVSALRERTTIELITFRRPPLPPQAIFDPDVADAIKGLNAVFEEGWAPAH